jgi:hypothetical protein
VTAAVAVLDSVRGKGHPSGGGCASPSGVLRCRSLQPGMGSCRCGSVPVGRRVVRFSRLLERPVHSREMASTSWYRCAQEGGGEARVGSRPVQMHLGTQRGRGSHLPSGTAPRPRGGNVGAGARSHRHRDSQRSLSRPVCRAVPPGLHKQEAGGLRRSSSRVSVLAGSRWPLQGHVGSDCGAWRCSDQEASAARPVSNLGGHAGSQADSHRTLGWARPHGRPPGLIRIREGSHGR